MDAAPAKLTKTAGKSVEDAAIGAHLHCTCWPWPLPVAQTRTIGGVHAYFVGHHWDTFLKQADAYVCTAKKHNDATAKRLIACLSVSAASLAVCFHVARGRAPTDF
jgi:hypothetical protein